MHRIRIECRVLYEPEADASMKTAVRLRRSSQRMVLRTGMSLAGHDHS
jgi:hypothetical protein